MRRTLPIAAAVAALTLTTLLVPTVPASAAPGLAAVASRAAVGAAPVAAAPAPALVWRRCSASGLAGAQCATLRVPRDWAAPAAKGFFDVAVARVPATAPARHRLGILAFNPGGPGGSGLDNLLGVWASLPVAVRTRFDLVTWDPRGVGATRPALAPCPRTEPALPATGRVDWAALARSVHAAAAADLAACLRVNAELAPYLSTWQVVRDLDAIRAAMRQPQLTFWGMSYGTTVGRVYAQTFPTRVRALVLDGAIDPRSTNASYAREQIWSTATAMVRFQGAAGAALRTKLQQVLNGLDRRTVPTRDGEYTRWDFASLYDSFLPREGAWDVLVDETESVWSALYSSSATSRRRAVAALSAAKQSRSPRASAPAPMTSLVNCSDMPDRVDADLMAAVVGQAAGVGGVVAANAALVQAAECSGLPAYGRALQPAFRLWLATPPIVVNSLGDSLTPWTGARAAANTFTGARMVTFDSTQHVTWQRVASTCVNDAVTTYVLTRRLPRADLACPLAPPSG